MATNRYIGVDTLEEMNAMARIGYVFVCCAVDIRDGGRYIMQYDAYEANLLSKEAELENTRRTLRQTEDRVEMLEREKQAVAAVQTITDIELDEEGLPNGNK